MRNPYSVLAITVVFALGGLGLSVPASAQTTEQPSSPQVPVSTYIDQGNRAFADGDYKAAIESYTQALQLYKPNEYAYYNRGNAYRKLKDYKAAISDYTNTLQLNPENTFAYLYRGMSYQANGESEAAIADYTALIKFDDQNPVAYHRRGEAYFSLKQKEAGLADLKQAADLYKKQKEPGLSEKVLSQLRSLK